MLSATPKVSVIMSTFNGERTIDRAVRSILKQTFSDWELIIIDDGSTDQTWNRLKEFENEDCRIRIYRGETNAGLASCLNFAIGKANGEYIARMDSDDYSCPTRLEAQVSFLNENQTVAVVGSNAYLVSPAGGIIRETRLPLTPVEIRKSFPRLCALLHPSVMYRKEFIVSNGGYDVSLRRAQDFDLWLRTSREHDFANLPEPLLQYQVSFKSSLRSDLYLFQVRFINAVRRREIVIGTFWAFRELAINIARKFGYIQKQYRK
ncbi:glycosyltransferase family 2 protein [Sulfitobacter sp. 916]|uniref:glycosyltransferase family 2 protein n=1 Tax=Sulfitobacter sp. 916 TaxID=3368559 RepID=UPI003747187A